MEDGNIALPFSVAFVMKKFEKFNAKNCLLDVKMTMIMRIKFNGLDKMKDLEHMVKVMKHCKDEL